MMISPGLKTLFTSSEIHEEEAEDFKRRYEEYEPKTSENFQAMFKNSFDEVGKTGKSKTPASSDNSDQEMEEQSLDDEEITHEEISFEGK